MILYLGFIILLSSVFQPSTQLTLSNPEVAKTPSRSSGSRRQLNLFNGPGSLYSIFSTGLRQAPQPLSLGNRRYPYQRRRTYDQRTLSPSSTLSLTQGNKDKSGAGSHLPQLLPHVRGVPTPQILVAGPRHPSVPFHLPLHPGSILPGGLPVIPTQTDPQCIQMCQTNIVPEKCSCAEHLCDRLKCKAGEKCKLSRSGGLVEALCLPIETTAGHVVDNINIHHDPTVSDPAPPKPEPTDSILPVDIPHPVDPQLPIDTHSPIETDPQCIEMCQTNIAPEKCHCATHLCDEFPCRTGEMCRLSKSGGLVEAVCLPVDPTTGRTVDQTHESHASTGCGFELDPGVSCGLGSSTAFYFDVITHSCSSFVYNGCGGNSNRFNTQQECEEKCSRQIITPGIIDHHNTPRIVDHHHGHGTGHQHITPGIEDHHQHNPPVGIIDHHNPPSVSHGTGTHDLIEPIVTDPALPKPEPAGNVPPVDNSHMFDPQNPIDPHSTIETDPQCIEMCQTNIAPEKCHCATHLCDEFPCGTGEMCRLSKSGGLVEAMCLPVDPTTGRTVDQTHESHAFTGCGFELDPGVSCGVGSSTAFYFDIISHSCSSFVYNGCGGNSNRFNTQQECEEKCSRQIITPGIVDHHHIPGNLDHNHGHGTGHQHNTPGILDHHNPPGIIDQHHGHGSTDQHNTPGVVDPHHNSPGVAHGISTHDHVESIAPDSITNTHVEHLGTGLEPALEPPVAGHDSMNCSFLCKKSLVPERCPCTEHLCDEHQCEPNTVCRLLRQNGMAEVMCVPQDSLPTSARSARPHNACGQPPKEGRCGFRRVMYYFDADTQSCKTFTYSGCGGNANRFITGAECENFCMNSRLTPGVDNHRNVHPVLGNIRDGQRAVSTRNHLPRNNLLGVLSNLFNQRRLSRPRTGRVLVTLRRKNRQRNRQKNSYRRDNRRPSRIKIVKASAQRSPRLLLH